MKRSEIELVIVETVKSNPYIIPHSRLSVNCYMQYPGTDRGSVVIIPVLIEAVAGA